ncbi:MAG: DUF4365 domain-containing protein [Treponema sp.]|nr:DUF4365 domain-containing protein [Treponema sp.]
MSDLNESQGQFPKDSDVRKNSSKARSLVPPNMVLDHWEFHDVTGHYAGCNLILELIEDGEFRNKKVECQARGTSSPVFICGDKYLSFDFSVKTANYALSGGLPFVLFVVDFNTKRVYWLSIKDYAKEQKDFELRSKKNKNTVSVRIPITNTLSVDNDSKLCELAKNGHL